MEEFGRDCSIRGYHVCKEILRQLLEKFWSVWESCTTFEIDMLWLWKKMGTAIRHLPWRLSRVCSFLLQQGGTISCTVTGGEGAEFSATPASISTCFSQRAIVSEVTGWCGLFRERKRFLFQHFLSDWQYELCTVVVCAQGTTTCLVRNCSMKWWAYLVLPSWLKKPIWNWHLSMS